MIGEWGRLQVVTVTAWAGRVGGVFAVTVEGRVESLETGGEKRRTWSILKYGMKKRENVRYAERGKVATVRAKGCRWQCRV